MIDENQEDLMPEASVVAQTIKTLPAMQEIWVRSLSWEDPLEKRMALRKHNIYEDRGGRG